MVKIARVDNGEVKGWRIVEEHTRPVDAEPGYGWYNVEEFDKTTLTLYENIDVMDIVYDSQADIVKEQPTITEPTLDEYKARVYRMLAMNTKEYVMGITPEYKQLTALASMMDPENAAYTQEESIKIRDFAKQHTDEVRRIKDLIFNATTKEEVDAQPTEVKFDWV